MKFAQCVRFLALIFCLTFVSHLNAADEAGFETIFDGKTLDGWDGNPDFWRVEDGTITGQTTAEKPTKGNTFIIWRKGETADFELKLDYKIIGGNSGIQYRSFEVPNNKWVIGGYQGDFEAADTHSGINYGEKFRGILCLRGKKTIIGENHKPKEVATFGDSKELQEKIKKEDWNEYRIVAKGFNFQHYINDTLMSDCTDEDLTMRRASGLLALQLHQGPPMKVQFRNIRLKKLAADPAAKQSSINAGKTFFTAAPADEKPAAGSGAPTGAKKKIVFVAGKPSHGYGAHEHYAGSVLLAKSLQNANLGIQTEVVKNGWPADSSVFNGADAIVMYCDGGEKHMVIPHLKEVDALAKKGVGIVCIHFGVEVPKGDAGDRFLDWIGGYFEANWSVNPHWTAKFEKFPVHPITRGVKPFEMNDEWYYHMRFRPNMQGVTPILSDLPGEDTLSRKDGAHSGNPDVRAAVLQRKEPQHVAWAYDRPDGGRGFGFTGGHDHWNWGDPNFRKILLNAILWTSKGEVPANGIEDAPISIPDLEANQDYSKPANFDENNVRRRLKMPLLDQKGAAPAAPKAAPAAAAAKPIFSSNTIAANTPSQRVEIDVDITGAKQLYLAVTDAGDGYGCDWADWVEPRLVGPKGEKKLTDLKWKSAVVGFGEPHVNKNCSGKKMKVDGQIIENGIGVHAVSVIAYDLPEGFTRFKAVGALDDGGTKQLNGAATSVQFQLYTAAPKLEASKGSGLREISHDPADAVTGLDVAEGLEATLFAAEPQVLNLTNLDIDSRGRLWVCEVMNYRKHNGKRPEGDRILILEDKNGDGKADDVKVFYQGRDVDSAMGICVLGNKVIVSASPHVIVFTDDNGDDVPDHKEYLFTKTGQPQHDHSAHSFIFGPDGKYYWNFGNTGKQVFDKNGKAVVDLAGNVVADNGKPYRGGMPFRCNADGSDFEVLAHNFRNNYETTIDSFGTLWQSDNDDDGNKAVRINYVMEFGNYGYSDEVTGGAWQKDRENIEKEIPRRHWHLNDPGVVPNLLQTGQGSPSGICFYEGRLLPRPFWNQVIHCDPGPNVVRAYPAQKDGAGYKAEVLNVLTGARDNWFRPADVCVAPDGSLFITDWYDPGVGGHNQQDLDRGRIFRVAPPGVKYVVPKFDFTTAEGAIEALKNPALSVRYLAFTTLTSMGDKGQKALDKLIATTDDPRLKARALWALGKMPHQGAKAVELAVKDKDPDVRIVGLRLARQLKMDVIPVVEKLATDSAPEVRRECAIALRHSKSTAAAPLWATLAMQHDGKDRWYLEALGIGADKNWDPYLDAYLDKVGTSWNTPAGKDVIWRSRAKKTPELLAKIIKSTTNDDEIPRYMRSFDFLHGPEKEAALKSLLE